MEAQHDFFLSLEHLGDLLVSSGDLAAARQRFEQSLAIGQRLTDANPSDLRAQRDVSVNLNRLGDVLAAAGDVMAARQRFEQGLVISQRLARADAGSAQAQRDLIISCAKLGQLTGEKDWWRQALEVAEQMNRNGQLAPSDSRMLEVLRQNAAVGK